jgi:hypothetical protein
VPTVIVSTLSPAEGAVLVDENERAMAVNASDGTFA